MSKVRTNDGYKDIEAVYAGNIPIDTIYDKNGNILFSAYNEVNGISPLSFKSKSNNSSTLKNYRIYGNTVSDESVGDKTGNLFNKESLLYNKLPNISTGAIQDFDSAACTPFIEIDNAATLKIQYSKEELSNWQKGAYIFQYDINRNFLSSVQIDLNLIATTDNANVRYIVVRFNNYTGIDFDNIMLNSGSEALPYEPYGYKVPVKIEGKNLVQNTATSQTINGVTFTVNSDGSVTCNGTADGTASIILGAWTNGGYILSGSPQDGSWNTYMLQIYSISTSSAKYIDVGFGVNILESENYQVRIRIASGYTCNNLTFYPMIRKADIKDNTYEPYQPPITTNLYLPEPLKIVGDEAEYIDFKEQKQHRVRKNLLQNTATTQTINNITFTVNQDYSITCNGRAPENLTATLLIPCYLYANETYKLTGTPQNTNGQVQLDMRDASGTLLRPLIYDNTGNGVIFSVNSSGDYKCGLRISPNYNCENITFYPMIRRAEIADGTYEPYITDTALTVTLPSVSIPSGTNILSVETEVQPSKVYLKGKIEEIPTWTVSYYSQDGSALLGTETVESGGNASGLQGTPTKPDTEQYTYTFVGWSNTTNATTAMSGILNNITADKSVYAVFTQTTKNYTVVFYNEQTLLETISVPYGSNATYTDTTPTKASTAQYNYNFLGWNTDSTASTADSDALNNITANRTVYAIFEQMARTFTVYFYNESTLLETVQNVPYGGTATYSGAAPTKQGYIFTEWSPSPTNITADTSCYAQFEEDELVETISDTWQEIIDNIGNGTYSSKYSVGDTKLIDLGTEGRLLMQVAALDTDVLADDSGTAPMTWISKQLLATSHRMNPAYSSGTEGTGALGGWEKTEMRAYLKNTIKPLIPEVVRNAIKPVKKYTRIYNVSGFSVIVLTTEDVWIPSYQEVFGNYSYESSGVYYSSAFPVSTSRVKHKVGGSAAWWWLRSAINASTFHGVGTKGSSNYSDVDSTGGVALGFCIGAPIPTHTVYFYNDDTLLQTVPDVPHNGTATYTGTTPTKQGYSFTGWSPLPTNITADTSCYAQFEEDDMYESITDTWSEIIANVSNGTYSTKYHIGDTKKIDLGTEGEVIMTIVGINADDLADNSGKAPITWISKQLLKTYHRMNPSKQSGTSGTGALGGWEACEMRNYLINTIKPLLPSEVRNALKTVKKYSKIYNTSETAVNNVVSNDDIWIPSAYEMNFTDYETSGVTYSTAFPDNASRIKHKVGGAAAWWWLRSANYTNSFRIVYIDGSNNNYNVYTSSGVAVGFCT